MDDGISATRASFLSALEHGDARAAAAVYTEHARLLPPSAELLQGRDEIAAFWKAGLEAGISQARASTRP